MPRDKQNEAKALWKSYKLKNKIGASKMQVVLVSTAGILFAALLIAGLYIVLR